MDTIEPTKRTRVRAYAPEFRCKFHELWINHQSTIGEQALKFFIQLYEIEREVRDMDAAER